MGIINHGKRKFDPHCIAIGLNIIHEISVAIKTSGNFKGEFHFASKRNFIHDLALLQQGDGNASEGCAEAINSVLQLGNIYGIEQDGISA